MNIGEKIKELRIKKSLTQSQLADKAKISRVTLGQYERGERQPNIDNAMKIADALKCSIGELTGEKYTLSQYILQKLFESGSSFNNISIKTNIPVSVLHDIRNGEKHNKDAELNFIRSLPELFGSNSNDKPNNNNYILVKLNPDDDIDVNKLKTFVLFLKSDNIDTTLLTNDTITSLYNKVHDLLEFELFKLKNLK